MFVIRIGPKGSGTYTNGRTHCTITLARRYQTRTDAARAAAALHGQSDWWVERDPRAGPAADTRSPRVLGGQGRRDGSLLPPE